MSDHMVKVKVCGITNLDDAVMALELGADALGFNFYPGSPRYIAPEEAAKIQERLPTAHCWVGVFVNESRWHITQISLHLGLQALQFHGDEEEKELRGWKAKIIKAFRVRGREDLTRALRCSADYLLLDALVEGHYGGTGQPWSWEVGGALPRDRVILAGGLRPDNVQEAIRTVRPFAVDVASGVERSPGRKDFHKLREFIVNAKAA